MRIRIRILPFNMMRIRILPLTFLQIWTLQCSPNYPLRLPPFHFDADPDPDFHFDADPDPTFHSDADPDPKMMRGSMQIRNTALNLFCIHNILHFLALFCSLSSTIPLPNLLVLHSFFFINSSLQFLFLRLLFFHKLFINLLILHLLSLPLHILHLLFFYSSFPNSLFILS
jgi:hypothetical protein